MQQLPPNPSSEPASNIISFRAAKTSSPHSLLDDAPLISERAGLCEKRCRQVAVIEKTRMLECRHCGRTLDPFDYLQRWALEGGNRLGWLKRVEEELNAKRTELEGLQRQVNNLRSQRRRLQTTENRTPKTEG